MADLKQEIDYPSNNGCVRKFNDIFCNWGIRRKPKDQSGNLKGMTSPLWANPAQKFFSIICGVAFLLVVLFVAAYIVIKFKNDDREKDKNGGCKLDKSNTLYIIIGSALLFVNAFYFCYLGFKEYASDQEWFRYIIIGLVFWAALVGVNIANYVFTVKNLKDKDNFKGCKNLLLANVIINFIVCIGCTIMEVLVIIRLILLFLQFFLKSFVPHTAKCVDDDIIIVE